MSNGFGDLKTLLDIKEKHGMSLLKELNLIYSIKNQLADIDSRGGTRVG